MGNCGNTAGNAPLQRRIAGGSNPFSAVVAVNTAPLAPEYRSKYDGIAALQIARLYRHRGSTAQCESSLTGSLELSTTHIF